MAQAWAPGAWYDGAWAGTVWATNPTGSGTAIGAATIAGVGAALIRSVGASAAVAATAGVFAASAGFVGASAGTTVGAGVGASFAATTAYSVATSSAIGLSTGSLRFFEFTLYAADGVTPAANKSGLWWIWWASFADRLTQPPAASGVGANTDANGVFRVGAPGTLLGGEDQGFGLISDQDNVPDGVEVAYSGTFDVI